MSALMPQADPGGPPTGGPGLAPEPGPPPPGDGVDNHESSRAQFAQVDAAKTMLDRVKTELESLQNLGDMITPEDVIEGAGKLVAHGAPAGQMAALLADMPEGGGPVLQAWLAQHEQMVAQKEAQLMPVHRVLGHRMAVAGMQVLAAQHQQADRAAPGLPGPLGT